MGGGGRFTRWHDSCPQDMLDALVVVFPKQNILSPGRMLCSQTPQLNAYRLMVQGGVVSDPLSSAKVVVMTDNEITTGSIMERQWMEG